MTPTASLHYRACITGLALSAATAVVCAITPSAQADVPANAPAFIVDPDWPQPLPNNWRLGPVSGIGIDARDHVVVVQRNESDSITKAGGMPAPHVIEFAPSGALVRAWGGPGSGYTWMDQVHGLTIDDTDRVWISGNGDHDAHLLVFTRTGQFVRQIGTPGAPGGSNDTTRVAAATQMRFDAAASEVFVSDGEQNRHHRVIVLDSRTGAYKRHWGAYGARPEDTAGAARFDPAGAPPKQFGSAVHCLRLGRDNLVYVCDRSNNRFQIFRKDGTFVREVFVARETAGAGSVWDIAFSPDEHFMYVADGTNQKIWILRHDTFEVVGSIGGPGSAPGRFATSLHDIMVDSGGNIFAGEAAAAGRIQKFRLQ